MAQFTKEVDLTSKESMAKFLSEHFRYFTMNSWNRSTSYAHNMKVYNIEAPSDIKDKLWNMLDTEEFSDNIAILINDFGRNHDWNYQAGFNGRSAGYLVLYQGGSKPSGYKSYCPLCGQRNYQEATDENNRCGKCGNNSRKNYDKEPISIFVTPGKSFDEYESYEDFLEWDIDDLKDRVELIKEFDQLAEDIKTAAIDMAKNYDVADEEYTIVKTRKVLVQKEENNA